MDWLFIFSGLLSGGFLPDLEVSIQSKIGKGILDAVVLGVVILAFSVVKMAYTWGGIFMAILGFTLISQRSRGANVEIDTDIDIPANEKNKGKYKLKMQGSLAALMIICGVAIAAIDINTNGNGTKLEAKDYLKEQVDDRNKPLTPEQYFLLTHDDLFSRSERSIERRLQKNISEAEFETIHMLLDCIFISRSRAQALESANCLMDGIKYIHSSSLKESSKKKYLDIAFSLHKKMQRLIDLTTASSGRAEGARR